MSGERSNMECVYFKWARTLLIMGMYLWVIVIFVVALNMQACSTMFKASASDQETPESCHLRELELCSMGLMSIFRNPNGLPIKEAELKRQCEFLNESMICLEKYSHHCRTDRQHGLVDLFAGSPRQVVTDFCTTNSELRMNYTKHIECFRQIQRKYQKTCLSDFQVGFEAIHKMNASLRLTTACCNIDRLRECLLVPIEGECGMSASETVENLLISTSGTWFNLPCRAYNSDTQDCQKLLPKIGTKPHNGRNTSALSKLVSGFTNVPAHV